jgi:hypothetical protein
MGTLPTGSVTSCNRQSSDSDVVHDHVWLRQHQIAPIARVGVSFGAGHVQHAGTTEGGQTMGGSPCGGELSPRGSPSKMISDGCPDTDRKL